MSESDSQDFKDEWKAKLNQLASKSNELFEIDFGVFLKSKYVRNKAVFLDSQVSHIVIPHFLFPPVRELLKKAKEINFPQDESRNRSTNSEGFVVIMANNYKPDSWGANYFRSQVTKGLPVIGDSNRKVYPTTNENPWHVAMIRFPIGYAGIFTTKAPYSCIDVYELKGASEIKHASRFEDGLELTVNDSGKQYGDGNIAS